MLTPIVSLWLIMRNSRTVASWFSPKAGSDTLSLVIAVLAIFVATYLAMKFFKYVFTKVFDYFRVWDMDRFLGGALGLFKATALLWIVIAFAFIAYPSGRKAISQSPIATQILLFGEGVPLLQQKFDRANRYVRALSNPLERYTLPSGPAGGSGNSLENLKALKEMDLGNY
jgi:uncharacterized membrane protein required for colicin V production